MYSMDVFLVSVPIRRLKLSKTRSTKPLEALSQSNGPFCVRKLVYKLGNPTLFFFT
jgi:hypothetical protein